MIKNIGTNYKYKLYYNNYYIQEGPLLISPLSTCNLTSGEWSPTRPGVFFIGKRDGTIEIWDLIDRY